MAGSKQATQKAEQRRQVMEILRDPLTCRNNATQIARYVGCGVALVKECRAIAEADGSIYMKGVFEDIEIAKLRLDGGTQSRAERNEEAVAEYAEAAKAKASFPEIGVVYDGTDYWVWDGFHRVLAFKQAGRSTIFAEIRQGTRRDAVLLSVGANTKHGLKRTNADKRRAVCTLLDDQEWRQWSDAEIARKCSVTQPFVSSIRNSVTYNDYKSERRKGADGRTISTANIGRSPRRVTEDPSTLDELKSSTFIASPPAKPVEEFSPNEHHDPFVEVPQFLPEPLPLDPDAATRLIVKHFQGDALTALVRGLANWAGIEIVEPTS